MRTLSSVNPTSEQLQLLADQGVGFRLIRGAAGSGKTTTALLRLRQLCASRLNRQRRLGLSDPVRILVLTFNRTLRGYVAQLAEEQIQESDELDVTVDTFARWALSIVGQRDLLQDDGESFIRQRLLQMGMSGPNSDYFFNEVKYIQGRFPSNQRADYLSVLRTGRGRAPAVPRTLRKRLLDEVVTPYEQEKSRLGAIDWNDLAEAAAAVHNHGYDVVVVDETQDLSANQVRAILAHLNQDYVATFIIDAMQRVYPQSFQWLELGITVRPEMVYTLENNYRNTAEIARLASSIIQELPHEEDGVIPDESSCQPSGNLPVVVQGKFSAQVAYMLDQAEGYLNSEETVAILHPYGYGWFKYVRQALRQRSIPFCELTRRSEWPTGPELLALSTLHSAKGLEFDHVFMPGLSDEVTPHGDEEGDGTLESLRRLIAMGAGRARRTVTLGYKLGERSTVFDYIHSSTYEEVKV